MILLLPAGSLRAQTPVFNIRERSVYLPAPQRPGKYDHALSLDQVYLPHQWLEQSLSAPMIGYKARYALPAGFALQADLKTLLIANDARLGASWNYALSEHLYAGLGYQLSFGFGMLKAFGYDNTMQVWQHHPSLSLGYSLSDIAFTLQGRLDWMTHTRLELNDYATTNVTGSMFNGYSAGLFIEQRITRRNSVSFGFIAGFHKFHILGWPALMIVDHHYFIPEVILGFKL